MSTTLNKMIHSESEKVNIFGLAIKVEGPGSGLIASSLEGIKAFTFVSPMFYIFNTLAWGPLQSKVDGKERPSFSWRALFASIPQGWVTGLYLQPIIKVCSLELARDNIGAGQILSGTGAAGKVFASAELIVRGLARGVRNAWRSLRGKSTLPAEEIAVGQIVWMRYIVAPFRRLGFTIKIGKLNLNMNAGDVILRLDQYAWISGFVSGVDTLLEFVSSETMDPFTGKIVKTGHPGFSQKAREILGWIALFIVPMVKYTEKAQARISIRHLERQVKVSKYRRNSFLSFVEGIKRLPLDKQVRILNDLREKGYTTFENENKALVSYRLRENEMPLATLELVKLGCTEKGKNLLDFVKDISGKDKSHLESESVNIYGVDVKIDSYLASVGENLFISVLTGSGIDMVELARNIKPGDIQRLGEVFDRMGHDAVPDSLKPLRDVSLTMELQYAIGKAAGEPVKFAVNAQRRTNFTRDANKLLTSYGENDRVYTPEECEQKAVEGRLAEQVKRLEATAGQRKLTKKELTDLQNKKDLIHRLDDLRKGYESSTFVVIGKDKIEAHNKEIVDESAIRSGDMDYEILEGVIANIILYNERGELLPAQDESRTRPSLRKRTEYIRSLLRHPIRSVRSGMQIVFKAIGRGDKAGRNTLEAFGVKLSDSAAINDIARKLSGMTDREALKRAKIKGEAARDVLRGRIQALTHERSTAEAAGDKNETKRLDCMIATLEHWLKLSEEFGDKFSIQPGQLTFTYILALAKLTQLEGKKINSPTLVARVGAGKEAGNVIGCLVALALYKIYHKKDAKLLIIVDASRSDLKDQALKSDSIRYALECSKGTKGLEKLKVYSIVSKEGDSSVLAREAILSSEKLPEGGTKLKVEISEEGIKNKK
ncbi:MAG: hypothetical protein JW994_01310, partial [Candidatus Omnitrophica bacterium]|nr:hypothetical protein [Candidatus Omnitrophota bacterium]